jgi:hypothetical protein
LYYLGRSGYFVELIKVFKSRLAQEEVRNNVVQLQVDMMIIIARRAKESTAITHFTKSRNKLLLGSMMVFKKF